MAFAGVIGACLKLGKGSKKWRNLGLPPKTGGGVPRSPLVRTKFMDFGRPKRDQKVLD